MGEVYARRTAAIPERQAAHHLFDWPHTIHLPAAAGVRTDAQRRVEIVRTIDPSRQNTAMGGIGADVLTLDLPVQKPDVTVPVIELFLKD